MRVLPIVNTRQSDSAAMFLIVCLCLHHYSKESVMHYNVTWKWTFLRCKAMKIKTQQKNSNPSIKPVSPRKIEVPVPKGRWSGGSIRNGIKIKHFFLRKVSFVKNKIALLYDAYSYLIYFRKFNFFFPFYN